MNTLRNILALSASLVIFQAPTTEAATQRRYQEVQFELSRIAAASPGAASEFVLGRSNQGVEIHGLRIGSGPGKALIVAAHHGNEYGSTEVALAAAAEFSQHPLPNHTVYIVPVLNVGGYDSRNREEREGANSHDPNRDYPGPCGSDSEFALQSTKALADFIDRERIVVSATLHTYYPAVVYPWGFATHDLVTPFEEQFKQLAVAATHKSQYEIGNSTEVIYPANGTFEDYAFWKHGVWSMLFELGYTHSPSQREIDEMIRTNVPGLRSMIELAPTARASNHAFTGKCDRRLLSLDRRDE